MLRIIRSTILPGALLTSCVVGVCADPAQSNAIESGKQVYSNRPAGYTVAVPYYGTPMVPRFMVAPSVPNRVIVAQAGSAEPAPLTPVPVVPIAPVAPIAQVAPITPVAPVALPQVVEKTTYILREPTPEVNVNDELDSFYARLAKIQLEKHLLDESLSLIQKIKSETTQVRTVVDFAEYVSRDQRYQVEAVRLYRLAVNGLEALEKKQPFNLGISPAQAAPVSTPAIQPIPVQTIPIQTMPVPAEPVKPEPVVVPSVPAITPPAAAPEVRPQPIPLDDEPVVQPPAEPAQPTSPSVRPPILLPEDSAKNGRKILPPPAPPRDLNNGIAVSPQAEYKSQRS